jgi:hypothetical protein
MKTLADNLGILISTPRIIDIDDTQTILISKRTIYFRVNFLVFHSNLRHRGDCHRRRANGNFHLSSSSSEAESRLCRGNLNLKGEKTMQ